MTTINLPGIAPGQNVWDAAFLENLQTQVTSLQSQVSALSALVAGGMLPQASALAQADWFFSPATGNDRNDGASAATPIKTWREFVRRVGAAPVYTSTPTTLTIHWLDDQPDDSDPIGPLFTMTNVDLVFEGSLINVGAGTFGAVTNIDRATGQLTTGQNADAGVPVDYWTQFIDRLVHDTTTDTWFRVDADRGARTAQFTQPFVGTPVLPTVGTNAEGTISNGDAYVIYRYPKVYVGNAIIEGISLDGLQTATFMHLDFTANSPDSGMQGIGSTVGLNVTAFLECSWSVAPMFLQTYPEGLWIYNCVASAGAVVSGAFWLGGCVRNFLTAVSPTVIDGDALIHGPIEVWTTLALCRAYFDVTIDVPFNSLSNPGTGTLLISNNLGSYGTAIVWGPAGLNVHSNGVVYYDGPALSQIQLTGALTIAGLATGCKVKPGTPRVYTDGVAITPANIDDAAGGSAPGMLSSNGSASGFFPYI